MARISGIDLPRDKRIEIALTYIYGIGRKTATNICAATGVDPDIRVRDLSEDDTAKLRDYIDKNCHVEGDLRRDVAFDIKRLIEIGCYRGVRHRKGLPVRGQRSKTNARTLHDLDDNWLESAAVILSSYGSLDEETKKVITNTLSLLIKNVRENLGPLLKEGRKAR